MAGSVLAQQEHDDAEDDEDEGNSKAEHSAPRLRGEREGVAS